MKGNVQICKADLCLKAEGDYAKILLGAILAIAISAAVVLALKK